MIHLTGHNYTAREVIQNIFSPLVGVVTSPLADEVCHRNNVSFVELVQPFAKLQNDAHFRDVSGTVVSVRGLRLNFCDVDWRPPQTMLARKMLNESVNSAHNDRTKCVELGSISLEVPVAEPWFEHWRETFLTVQFPADHEFTRHLLSCLIILSSGDPAIVETAQKLTQQVQQMQSMTPQKLPKWFHPLNVLNSYVVLHEGSEGDISKAQQGYELLKSTFGDSKCFLIQVNSLGDSVSNETFDYWSPFIRKQPKTDASTEQVSASKTPQEEMSTIAMPNLMGTGMDSSTGSGSGSITDVDLPIFHPLSPVQERATEAIKSKFSISSESIASQTINPNVWAQETDVDLPRGQCLNAMDIENLRHFVQDYSVRALIPYVESLVAILTEAITNKKGVSKSLLSATKRWFATSKPGAGVSSQNAVIYTHESSELQTRKLGDLYFMFGHYNLAFQAYHQAKRDFNADSAWQYYAGALEMAAVSAFMLGTANRKTYDYMEDAIICYLNVCKLQQFATRATLLSIECLKTARLYGEAAKQLIRMTCEESDLRSALLLEQAAYCFLATQPPMHRKYAFHIVLSGNRFSRACQRKHAYRCYKQAYQVFKDRGWGLAEDHIQYTIAKQAAILKKLDEASMSFAHLLRPGSMQNAQQQMIFLKEYIQTQNDLNQNSDSGLRELALPRILQNSVRVLTLPYPPIANPLYIPANNIDIKYDMKDETIWQKLEEMIVLTVASNKSFVFKPTCNLFSRENLTVENPLAVQGEPIELAVTISNTVRCNITLTDINLIWKLRLDNNDELSNLCLYEANNDSATTTAINAVIKSTPQSCILDELSEKTLYFKLTPKVTGSLNIVGLVCRLAIVTEPTPNLLGILYFEAQKLRQSGKQSTQTLFDNKLSIKVVPQVPSLGVSFSPVPSELLMGEIVPVTISLRNSGIVPIQEIYVSCDTPRWITFLDKEAETPLSVLSLLSDLKNEKLVKEKEIRKQRVFRLLKRDTTESMKAQETTCLQMWIQAPYTVGKFTLRLLFYYALPSSVGTSLKYRLVRHTWNLNISESLRTEASCVISNSIGFERALSIKVKNENAPHHSLRAEFCINSINLYSDQHRLTDKIHYVNKMEIEKSQFGESILKSLKSVSFQCPLKSVNANNAELQPKTGRSLFENRLSELKICDSNLKDHHTEPPLVEPYGFLAKNETILLNSSISTEEFNNIVVSRDYHLTVVIGWSAKIVYNSKEREAVGQHFIQLKHIFDPESCPPTTFNVNKTKNSLKLCDFPQKSKYNDVFDANEDSETDIDESEVWESNSSFIANRCLLEDSNYLLIAKS